LSDEDSCNFLSLGKNYAKELLPSDLKGSTLKVYLNVSILAIPNIDTNNIKYTVDFYLSMRWYDPRITANNLNDMSSLNSLSLKEINSIWTPQLAFDNGLGPFETEIDKLSHGKMVRETGALAEDYTTATEGQFITIKDASINYDKLSNFSIVVFWVKQFHSS
jgi:hypothetical protein